MNNNDKFEAALKNLDGRKPNLLLHACCAPCSSSVLERLADFFNVAILFFNPNIYPESEFSRRELEFENFLQKSRQNISLMKIPFNHADFLEVAQNFENESEGGFRCFRCYELRLRKTAEIAKERGFECFCTTLSVSPHKNAEKINEIGEKLGKEFDLTWIYSDFKKKNGFLRSLQLSAEYGLYRQDYCGCEFSMRNRGLL